MKAFLARNGIYFAAAAAITLAVHVVTLFTLPHFVMAQALGKISQDGGYNAVRHIARADEHSRAVVRPSPDLLYSTCPFDLSKGPLRVQATVPPGTYWSVSVFDANTNNIFVVNDRQAKDGKVDFVVLPPISAISGGSATTFATPPNAIRSPSTKGLVLFRTLINDEARFAVIDAARRKVTCGIDHASSSWKTN